MENHFKEQCGIDDDKVIRAGYPCCIHNEAANSFDHDVLKRQGLPENTKIVVYSPTYRENYKEDLKYDYPRIPFTKDKKIFDRLQSWEEN